jgi:hypothetical protein
MNWKPAWRIRRDDQTAAQGLIDEVRMYDYANSSDFRFYSSSLLELGADQGDIVQITRIAEPDAELECVLARGGSVAHRAWIAHCTEPVRNSNRRYGYA